MMSEWIKVSDQLPPAFELVILCQGEAVFTGMVLGSKHGVMWESGNGFWIEEPDAWMPMPEPMQEQDDE